MQRLRRLVFSLLLALASVALALVFGEGIYSLVAGRRAHASLSWLVYTRWIAHRPPPPFDPRDPNARMVTNSAQISSILDELRHDGVGIGNSPFKELKTPQARVNGEIDGCWSQKPDQHKTITFLRSNLFNPFDQMTAFYDADRQLSPDVEQLVDRYGFRKVRHNTNQYGERVTIPAVESQDLVLVAGDSIADGLMLDDSETLSSQLQGSDRSRRYVNLGIPGAAAADVVCALDRAAKRYPGRIRDLIYVFCENDYSETEPYGQPEELIAWLTAFQKQQGIDRVVFVYVPYIYNSVPEVTRVRGHSQHDFPTFHDEKQRLLEGASRAGFQVVDFLSISDRVQREEATQFAPLALYVDHSHLSRRGIALLAAKVAPDLQPGRPASGGGDARPGREAAPLGEQ